MSRYNAWSFPTLDQLSKIRQNLYLQGKGDFANDSPSSYHWSVEDDASYAYVYRITSGVFNSFLKSSEKYTIAVRTFIGPDSEFAIGDPAPSTGLIFDKVSNGDGTSTYHQVIGNYELNGTLYVYTTWNNAKTKIEQYFSEPPDPIAVDKIVPRDSSLFVYWTCPDVKTTEFKIYLNTTNNPETAVEVKTLAKTMPFGSSVVPTGRFTYKISGLSNDTTYYIWIKAKNSKGYNDFGTVGTGIPVSTPVIKNPTSKSIWNYISINSHMQELVKLYKSFIDDSSDFTRQIWANLVAGSLSYVFVASTNYVGAVDEYELNEAYVRPVRSFIDNADAYCIGEKGPGRGYVYAWTDNGDGTYTYYEITKTYLTDETVARVTGESIIAAYPVDVPEKPSIIELSARNNTLKVTWDAASLADTYEVWYNTVDDVTTATQSGGSISLTEHLITGLTNNTEYFVWVRGINDMDPGEFSNPASKKPAPTTEEKVKITSDMVFSKAGNTINLRKYVLNSTWYGDFPHRDSNANDYPIGNMVSLESRGFCDVKKANAGASRQSWTDGTTGNTYPTSVRKGELSCTLYLPYSSEMEAFLAMNLIPSSTANRSFNYGRDVILFKRDGIWYWAGTVSMYKYGDNSLHYKLEGQAVDQLTWPFEFCFDERGIVKDVEKVIPGLTTAPIILDLDV